MEGFKILSFNQSNNSRNNWRALLIFSYAGTFQIESKLINSLKLIGLEEKFDDDLLSLLSNIFQINQKGVELSATCKIVLLAKHVSKATIRILG